MQFTADIVKLLASYFFLNTLTDLGKKSMLNLCANRELTFYACVFTAPLHFTGCCGGYSNIRGKLSEDTCTCICSKDKSVKH